MFKLIVWYRSMTSDSFVELSDGQVSAKSWGIIATTFFGE